MLRILIDDVFLEYSRCKKHKSNMSNKRMNGPSLLLLKQKKKGLISLDRLAAKNRISVLREAKDNGRTFVRATI